MKAVAKKGSIITLIIALMVVAALAASPVFGADAVQDVGDTKTECLFDHL